MKKIALIVLLALAGQPALADHRHGSRLLDVSYEDNPYNCTRTEVRIVEEFGVVNTYRYTSSLPGCSRHQTRYHQGSQHQYPQPVSAAPAPAPMSRAKCRNQALIGTAAGAGIAAAVSKKDAYGWSIPVGAAAGFLLGRHDCL